MLKFPNSFDIIYPGGEVTSAVLAIILGGSYIEIDLKDKQGYVDSLFSILMELEFKEEYRDIDVYFVNKLYTLTQADRSALCTALISHRYIEDFGESIDSRLH